MKNNVNAQLKQPEIVQLLKAYGFEGLRLKTTVGQMHTYSFSDFDQKGLVRTLGTPALTSDKKVMVFEVSGTGKLGVAPASNLVRFKDTTKTDRAVPNSSHLANVKVPAAYEKAYMQAQVSPALRVAFCKKLFDYFNKEKFEGKLERPALTVSDKNPKGTSKTTRGAHTGGRNFAPGVLWMASFMFNARPPFFYEVFLHEMCHLAAWTISRSTDFSLQGHGPTWQSWMTRVGLDPRRYDPTDDTEYKLDPAQKMRDAEDSERYGPPVSDADMKKLTKLNRYSGYETEVYRVINGRLFFGTANKKTFIGVAPNKKSFTFTYPSQKSLGDGLYTKL